MRLLAAFVIAVGSLIHLGLPNTSGLDHWLVPQTRTNTPSSVDLGTLPLRSGNEPLAIGATSAYAVDYATMTPLYSKNQNAELPIASLTKMVTVLVVLRDHALSETVTVGKLPAYQTADELLGLKTGQKFKLSDLLAATLISSDDDAADALAIYDAGSTTKFEAKMNATMQQLGITDTRFDSASGLNDVGNFATARNLAIIAKVILQNQTVRNLVKQPTATISDSTGQTYTLKSTDDLLATGIFSGIKTGYTAAAGQCFVGLTSIDSHSVITVVLDSNDRFGDTTALRDWILRNWQWQTYPPSS